MGKHVLEKLTAMEVTRAKSPGYYSDGGNLWLRVSKSGSKSWAFIFTSSGKTRQMGFGSLHRVSLQKAREKAAQARELLDDGKDPIDLREQQRSAQKLEKAKRITFEKAADAYIAKERAGWKNEKHADQWTNTIRDYANPIIGPLAVADVDTGLVMQVLSPIWNEKNETAMRLRGRLETILDWATVQGFRTGPNPARFKGHLDKLLTKISRKQRIEHHAALPYAEAGTFMAALSKQEGTAARALEFAILTAARTGEVIGATWEEIDLAGKVKVWTIPAERMKADKEHRIPLSAPAVRLLRKLSETRQDGYVFSGRAKDKPLSNMAMLAVLKRMSRKDLTVHGFRSTFRDWAADRTNFPPQVAEMALAHAIANDTEAAYRRGDLFDKRVKLMEAWASFATTIASVTTVIQFSAAQA